MERITAEQIAQLDLKKDVRRVSEVAHIYKAIGELGVGDGLVVPKEEWTNKNKPAQSGFPKEVCTNGRKYRVSEKADSSGFVIIRTA